MNNWNSMVSKVEPSIVKIETPTGFGTGFLCLYNDDKSWCGIATACHVLSYAEQWQQPIRITQLFSGKTAFIKESVRAIYLDYTTDSAIILIPIPPDFRFPPDPIPMRNLDKPLNIGAEIGWMGFPYLEPNKLCFFSGCVSARKDERKAYLIDGVSINGVSGGPVIYAGEGKNEVVEIIGLISAYMANKATGETLPGLLIAQDVSHLHDVAKKVKSIDEARKEMQQKKEKEASQENITTKA
jgi:hypothetical protein